MAGDKCRGDPCVATDCHGRAVRRPTSCLTTSGLKVQAGAGPLGASALAAGLRGLGASSLTLGGNVLTYKVFHRRAGRRDGRFGMKVILSWRQWRPRGLRRNFCPSLNSTEESKLGVLPRRKDISRGTFHLSEPGQTSGSQTPALLCLGRARLPSRLPDPCPVPSSRMSRVPRFARLSLEFLSVWIPGTHAIEVHFLLLL